MSEGQDHIPYMGEQVFLEIKVGHLTTLSPFLLLFILIWNLEKSHQICAGLFGKYIFTKLIPKVNGKMFEIQLKTLSSMGTGKEILLNC